MQLGFPAIMLPSSCILSCCCCLLIPPRARGSCGESLFPTLTSTWWGFCHHKTHGINSMIQNRLKLQKNKQKTVIVSLLQCVLDNPQAIVVIVCDLLTQWRLKMRLECCDHCLLLHWREGPARRQRERRLMSHSLRAGVPSVFQMPLSKLVARF